MGLSNELLFSPALWAKPLESYASASHISVKLFNAEGQAAFGPVHSTPLLELFEGSGYDPGLFAECARRCLTQNGERKPVIVSEFYGLSVIGTPLVQEGKIVGAAVGGYAFLDFSQVSEVQRLARNAGIEFERLWRVAREQKPVPQRRLMLNGELLRVLGDSLLRENHRTRQYEETAAQLQVMVKAEEQAHRKLRQTMAELRESEARLQLALDASGMGTFTWYVQEDRGEPDARLLALFGLPANSTISLAQALATLIHPDDRAGYAEAVARAIDPSGDGTLNTDIRVVRPDESVRWLTITARTFFEESAPRRAIRMSGVAANITARKQAEAAAREREERLRKVEKIAAAGQLASSLAHEINNPLSSVTNALYLLENYPNMEEPARAYATMGAAELGRVSRIVKQSLSYYRAGTTPRELDLGAIVNESLQIFGGKFERAGVKLKVVIHDGTMLLGFPGELRQVIDNLLLNALDAMPDGGRLGISVRGSFDWRLPNKRRGGVRLTIADDGCGIPKALRERIFEPFYTTKEEKGTGLGLWILQGIISKHDGSMSLRSSDRKGRSGTIISIFLPSHVRELSGSNSAVQSAA